MSESRVQVKGEGGRAQRGLQAGAGSKPPPAPTSFEKSLSRVRQAWLIRREHRVLLSPGSTAESQEIAFINVPAAAAAAAFGKGQEGLEKGQGHGVSHFPPPRPASYEEGF